MSYVIWVCVRALNTNLCECREMTQLLRKNISVSVSPRLLSFMFIVTPHFFSLIRLGQVRVFKVHIQSKVL